MDAVGMMAIRQFSPPHNVAKRRRIWMSPIFSSAPPTGMIYPLGFSTRCLPIICLISRGPPAKIHLALPFFPTLRVLSFPSFPSFPLEPAPHYRAAISHVPATACHHVLDAPIRAQHHQVGICAGGE